jgi:hypothetical protein
MVYVAGVFNLVTVGAYGRDIAVVVGADAQYTSTWLVQVVTILIVVLSPPISEAADLWGRKWLLVGITGCGVASPNLPPIDPQVFGLTSICRSVVLLLVLQHQWAGH